MNRNLSLPVWLLAACTTLSAIETASRVVAAECRCNGVCCCTQSARHNGWQVEESRNFRFHHVGQRDVANRLVRLCEYSRKELRERWTGGTGDWTPKCDVYLYPTVNDYCRLTRYAADSWGYADLEIGDGKVWMRRLDLRADDRERLASVALHELSHIVVAERFATQRIPRWADEGIALLSEPAGRRSELRAWLNDEMRIGRAWPLRSLVMLAEYPRDRRLGDLFYAESGAFVEFLLRERQLSETDVVAFIERVQAIGLDKAVSGTWPRTSTEDLEASWRAWILGGS